MKQLLNRLDDDDDDDDDDAQKKRKSNGKTRNEFSGRGVTGDMGVTLDRNRRHNKRRKKRSLSLV